VNARRLSAAVSACLPAAARAAEVPAVAPAANLGRTLFGLAVVIALVFGLAWAAKRVGAVRRLGGAGAGAGPIQVVAQHALGARERLLLVEVDGKRLLLGVVPGSITRLDADLPIGDRGGDSGGVGARGSEKGFSARLGAARRDRS